MDRDSVCAKFAHTAYDGKITDIYATRQARRHIPMTMADWSSKLEAGLQFNDAEILRDKGKVSTAIVKAFTESEFEQYRVLQDKSYVIDFDRLMMEADNTLQDK